MENIKVGKSYKAKIVKILKFGAFVEVDETEGLLHISQIAPARLHMPEDVITEGQYVNVKCIELEDDKLRFSMLDVEQEDVDVIAKIEAAIKKSNAKKNDRPRRDSGDRPRRGFGDKPRGERSRRDFGDRPRRGENSDRPRRDFGDRPRRDSEDRPRRFDDKPRGDRNFSDRPRRNFGDRPRRDGEDRGQRRDFGGKPRRDFGDKPRGDRNFSDRPRRDSGDRPQRSFRSTEMSHKDALAMGSRGPRSTKVFSK